MVSFCCYFSVSLDGGVLDGFGLGICACVTSFGAE